MKIFSKKIYGIIVIFLSACAATKSITGNVNYYFDPEMGSDLNSGTSPAHPFKSLRKIRELHLKPGDSVLLNSGAVFNEQLYISCKGDSAKPIVVGKYGGDAKPHIKGDASQLQSVHVFNSGHIIIRDLEISNKGDSAIDGLNGILVELLNYGTAKDITIDNLYIHDVYGILVREKKGGGNAIMLKNFHDEKTDIVSSRFDGLTVQNCLIKDCQRNGIMMWGNWIRKKWNPSLHVLIRNNIIDGVPGDGIVPVACESPLIEYNVMKNCPAILPSSEACNGIWPWSCDNAVIQYNIVSDHKSQVDGYGFDSDWNSRHSLFQYNLSYNNDGGFLLICNQGGLSEDWNIGNSGTIIRYNISINDGLRNYSAPKSKREYFSPIIHMTGPTENSLLEKNIFYIYKKPEQQIDKILISFTDWSGYPDSTFIKNNFIYAAEPNQALDTAKSTNNFFENNFYVGELKTPEKGFEKYNRRFNQQMWYDASDKNWDKLLKFIDEKSIPINGIEIKVKKIIGFN
jgi:hypothetical protein